MQRYSVVAKYIPTEFLVDDTRKPKFMYEKVIFKKRPGIVNRCEDRIKHKGKMISIYLIDLKSKEKDGPRVEKIWGDDIEFDMTAGSILRGQLQGISKRKVESKIDNKGTQKFLKPRIRLKQPDAVTPAVKKEELPAWKPPYKIKLAGVDTYEALVPEIDYEN